MYHSNLISTTRKGIQDYKFYKSLGSDEKSSKLKIFNVMKCHKCGKDCLADNDQVHEMEIPNPGENVFTFISGVGDHLKQAGLTKVREIPEPIIRDDGKFWCSKCHGE